MDNVKVIAITGCCGMIGSNLSHWFIDNTDYRIIGVDNLSGGFIENIPDNERFILFKNDVCDNDIDGIFDYYKPNIVYHAAAYAAENLSPFIRKYNYTNNLVGTANIVNACINHDVDRLVFFSSIAVYGHGEPPYVETQIPTPNDPYGISKFACEMDIRVAGEQHGLNWCIVRPFNVYGKRQNTKDKYRNVLGIFINQYLNNQPFSIFGDGSQTRSFTNVDDIMIPLYNAGMSEIASKQIINIGSDVSYTVLDAAYLLQDIIGGGKITFLDGRHEVHTAVADIEKAHKILDYKHKTALYEGLKDMYEWVLKNPSKGETIAPEYEITKGMYNAWKK